MTGFLGVLGVAGFAWLCLFQMTLAAGLPIGRMAWGGQYRVLPASLRWASLAVVPFMVLGVLVVAQAASLIEPLLPDVVVRPALGGFAALFALSFVGNAASKSRVERLHGVPLTAVICSSTLGLFFLA